MQDRQSRPVDANPVVIQPGPVPPAAIVLTALTLSLVVVAAVTTVVAGEPAQLWFDAFYVIAAIAYPVMGVVIVRRIPTNQVGWLLIAIGVTAAAALAAVGGAATTAAPLGVDWIAEWLPVLPLAMLPLPLLVFPNGPLQVPWWRTAWGIAWSTVVLPAVLLAIGTWLEPLPIAQWPDEDAQFRAVADPYIGAGILSLLVLVTATVTAGGLVVCARRRMADAHVRGQLRLLALGLSVVPPVLLLGIWFPDVLVIAALSVPVAMTLAIVAHGLYDIDLFINRSIVYSMLTVVIFAAYTATVEIVNTAFRASPLASFAGTGVVAAVFKPVRDHVQSAVNRLLYGDRDEPFAVLTRLGRQLEAVLDPDSVLSGIADTVMTSLRLPYVEVRVRRDGRLRQEIQLGRLIGEPAVYAMRHKGSVVGELVVAPRQVGHGFSAEEDLLLTELAGRAAGAVAAVVEVQVARTRRERLA